MLLDRKRLAPDEPRAVHAKKRPFTIFSPVVGTPNSTKYTERVSHYFGNAVLLETLRGLNAELVTLALSQHRTP
jgi:hypothetical protein